MCRKRYADGAAVVRLPAVEAILGLGGGHLPVVEAPVMLDDGNDDLQPKTIVVPATRRAATTTASGGGKTRREMKKEEEVVAKKSNKTGRRRASKHGFRGIHQRPYGRWGAEIRDKVIEGARVWIGTFDTAEEAALAYDATARRLYGCNAKTNFPVAGAGDDDDRQAAEPAAVVVAAPAFTGEEMGKQTAPAAAADPGAGELGPVLLCQALEATNGWQYEAYGYGYSMGLELLDNYAYAGDVQPLGLGGSTTTDCLWMF